MGQRDLQSRRVLVADDEDAIRALVGRILSRAGFQPVHASDGAEAIECLDSTLFDAVVLDLMMPRVDGFGVLKHLIETQPLMVEKTVVLTAFPRAAVQERVHQLCCVLSKPFELGELISAVSECARR
jgi:DNA-binding response OmpR family regulator